MGLYHSECFIVEIACSHQSVFISKFQTLSNCAYLSRYNCYAFDLTIHTVNCVHVLLQGYSWSGKVQGSHCTILQESSRYFFSLWPHQSTQLWKYSQLVTDNSRGTHTYYVMICVEWSKRPTIILHNYIMYLSTHKISKWVENIIWHVLPLTECYFWCKTDADS